MNHRYVIKFAGESGQGINSLGEITVKALKNLGYYTFGYREYPSLIRGGFASYQLDISDQEVRSPSQRCDLLVSVSRSGIHAYLKTLNDGGVLLHSLHDLKLTEDEEKIVEDRGIDIHFVSAEEEAVLVAGNKIFANVIFLGLVWRILCLDYETIEHSVLKIFGKNKKYIKDNKKALKRGFEDLEFVDLKIKLPVVGECSHESAILSGNEAIALGAISAGVRAYYAYPMTPASSILSNLANMSMKSGMLVRQVEDEITAAQMALGSTYMGTRAMTGTSGGGFDLMTETVSMSGIAEIPQVIILAQRPGPGTGLPTWNANGDLNIAVYGGHGEYPRAVISCSDAQSAYKSVARAFNIAEVYQIPVVLLTEKHIAESLYSVPELPVLPEIQRGLVEDDRLEDLSNSDRYAFSSNGVSSRWLPGSSEAYYVTNSDEHGLDGSTTEDAEVAKSMMDKRALKMRSLLESLPEPDFYGEEECELLIVGWGSSKGVMLDYLDTPGQGNEVKVGYLHYEYIYPMRSELLMKHYDRGVKIVAVEQNQSGQLAKLISAEVGITVDDSILKYDGRPLYLGEVQSYVKFFHLENNGL